MEDDKKQQRKIYTSDDDLSDDQLEHISWRMPASTSRSDWTIEIVNKQDTSDVSVYHVHTAFLAVGYKRSEYFARLFAEDGRFAESRTMTSRIELEPAQAKVFPNLLDFLYSPTGKLNATTDNIMDLFALGQYFEMAGLRRQVRKFWHQDMTTKTWLTYYKYSKERVNNEKLEKSVLGFWAHRIDQFDMDFLPYTDYDFWIKVIDFASCCVYHQKRLSVVLARFCRQNVESLQKESFERLTREECLPEVHVEAVIDFLEAENSILSPAEIKEGTDLQTRCLRAIRRDWQQLHVGTGNFLLDELGKCNSGVLSKVLVTLLAATKKTVNDMEVMVGTFDCASGVSSSSSSSSSSVEQSVDESIDGDY